MKQAAVMLIIRDGMILGVSRKDDPSKFGLIGGKVDDGEHPVDAAIREVKEETGIIIKACQPIIKREVGDDFEAYAYYATIWEGEPTSIEGTTVSWLTEEEMTKTKAAFPDYNIATINRFKELFPNIPLKQEVKDA